MALLSGIEEGDRGTEISRIVTLEEQSWVLGWGGQPLFFEDSTELEGREVLERSMESM